MRGRKFRELSEEAAVYDSGSQNARALTEDWAVRNLICPNCSSDSLEPCAANSPVADLFCPHCGEEYELKSSKKAFGKKVVDGAYGTMMERLKSNSVPNLVLLNYSIETMSVSKVTLVPKFFFTPQIIEKRKPLAETARRAGWVGCNILLHRVPSSGQIPFVNDNEILPAKDVREAWQRNLHLRQKSTSSRNWLMATQLIVDRMSNEFELSDVYGYENALKEQFPNNSNIRPKLRQQLQVLRDQGFIEFVGKGRYRRLL